MKKILLILFSLVLVFAFLSCVEPEEEKAETITISSITANGTLNAVTSTRLIFSFDKSIKGFTANDIVIAANGTGVTKGALREAEVTGEYILNIYGITNAGSISVEVKKTGFTFIGSPKEVIIHLQGSAFYPPGPLVDVAAQTTPLTGGTVLENRGGNTNLANSPYGYEVFMYQEGSPENNKFTWYGPEQGGGGAFKAEWDGYFLARLGFYWGNGKEYTEYKNIYIDYNYRRSENGTGGNFSWIGTYGWSRNPSAANEAEKLIEWYIVDDNFANFEPGQQPSPGRDAEKLGSFEVDGATYYIWKRVRTDQSIDGRRTFTQILSIRDFDKRRQSGTISVTEHFKEWDSKYIKLGNLYEAKFKSEAGGGKGWLDLSYLYLSQEDNPRE